MAFESGGGMAFMYLAIDSEETCSFNALVSTRKERNGQKMKGNCWTIKQLDNASNSFRGKPCTRVCGEGLAVEVIAVR